VEYTIHVDIDIYRVIGLCVEVGVVVATETTLKTKHKCY
jgi:hypothetical protein